MSDELKACDRCNGAAKFGVYDCEDRTNDFTFFCKDCGFETGYFNTEAEAIAAWNTRPIEDALRQRVKKQESLNLILINGQHQLEKTAMKYMQRVKELEEKLEAYSAVGTSLMRSDLDGAKRIKELENQVFTLSAGTRNSRDKERVKELEAWQKEAHPYLVNYRNSLHPDSSMYLAVEKLIKRIEQAEEHGE